MWLDVAWTEKPEKKNKNYQQAFTNHTFSTDVANLKIDSNNVKVVWYIPYFNLCKESQRLKMIGFALSLKIISEQLIF